MKKTSLLGLIVIVFTSCNNGLLLKKTVESEIAAIDYLYDAGLSVRMSVEEEFRYVFEKREIYNGKDIVKYFGKIPAYVFSDIHEEDMSIQNEFYESLRMLEKYARGKTKEYPYELIRRQINLLAAEYAKTDSEGYGENLLTDINHLFTRYTDIAFKYCPDIKYFATQTSEDGRAGIMEMETQYRPLFNLMIFESYDGVNYRVEHYRACLPTRVRVIEQTNEEGTVDNFYLFDLDPNGPEYYWYSSPGWWWRSLALFSDGNENLLSEDEVETAYDWIKKREDYHWVIFFPEELKWKFCVKVGNEYHPIHKLPSLRINLEGYNHLEIVSE